MEPYVLSARRGALLTLTLNRGDRFNPLSLGMIGAFEAALDEAATDTGVRAIILAATGRGFCAGHDLKEIKSLNNNTELQSQLFADCNRMMFKLTQLPQPVIARVHGLATAAGCQLVSMCDLAVASDAARFALPGVSIGLFCSTPAVGVARNIGRKRSMEMLLTGDLIDAATALEWGLVNRVVPGERLDAEVDDLAQRIAARSAPTVALGKRTFYAQIDTDLNRAAAIAGDTMVRNLGFADAAEGIDAFIAKRPAEWHNHR